MTTSTAAPPLPGAPAHDGESAHPAGHGGEEHLQEWAEFASALRATELTTTTLTRWTGSTVSVEGLERSTGPVLTDLVPTGAADGDQVGQHRHVTLAGRIGGRMTTLARASAEVRLDVLPAWAQHVLQATQLPLGRTLYRAGAARTWVGADLAPVQQADSDGGTTGRTLRVQAVFTLPDHGVVARVREHFPPSLLALRAEPGAARPAGNREQQIDDVDVELVALLSRRRDLARRQRPDDGSAPPAYPVPDELLRHQLCEQFGRAIGAGLYAAITRPAPAVVDLPRASARPQQAV